MELLAAHKPKCAKLFESVAMSAPEEAACLAFLDSDRGTFDVGIVVALLRSKTIPDGLFLYFARQAKMHNRGEVKAAVRKKMTEWEAGGKVEWFASLVDSGAWGFNVNDPATIMARRELEARPAYQKGLDARWRRENLVRTLDLIAGASVDDFDERFRKARLALLDARVDADKRRPSMKGEVNDALKDLERRTAEMTAKAEQVRAERSSAHAREAERRAEEDAEEAPRREVQAIVDELCGLSDQLAKIDALKRRDRAITRSSGVTSLSERRRLAGAEVDIKAQMAEAMKRLRPYGRPFRKADCPADTN